MLRNSAVDRANQLPYLQKWLLTETVNNSYQLCQQPLPIVPFTFIGARPRSAVSRAPDSCQRSWVRYPVWPHAFVSPSADSGGAVVSYWQKYVHEVLVNCLGGLSLPRKSVVRLTDCSDMTVDVYRDVKQQ